MLGNNN